MTCAIGQTIMYAFAEKVNTEKSVWEDDVTIYIYFFTSDKANTELIK